MIEALNKIMALPAELSLPLAAGVLIVVYIFIKGLSGKSHKINYRYDQPIYPKVKLNRGEQLIDNALKRRLDKKQYHVISNATLPYEGSTTQIDHIIISLFGIFIIETKDYSGTVYTNNRANWYQYCHGKKYTFQNPHRQNYKHTLAVKKLLPFINDELFYGSVIFIGDAKLKEVPENTYTKVMDLVNFVKEKTNQAIDKKTMAMSVGILEIVRRYDCPETDQEHIENVKRDLERKAKMEPETMA